MTSSSPRRRGKELLAEAVLIVASILLAFAIDAAWEGRDTSRREQTLLAGLGVDFERNQRLLDDTRAAHRAQLQAALTFLDLSQPGGPAPADRIDDDVLIALVSWATYDPILGTLNSAIASGQLSLVSNPKLRAELAGWIDLVQDLNETEEADRGHATRFATVAFEFVPFRSAVYRLGNGSLGRPSSTGGDYAGLLRSLTLENIAVNRVAEIGFVLDDLEAVQKSLESILALISQERT